MSETVTVKQLTPAPDVKVLGCYLEHEDAEPEFFPVSVAGWGIEEVWCDGEQLNNSITLYIFEPVMTEGGNYGHPEAFDKAGGGQITYRACHASAEISGPQRDGMVNEIRTRLRQEQAA